MDHPSDPWHEVRRSPLHGHGVFARRPIPKGTYILEYEGVHITQEQADAQEPSNPDDPFHTFFFAISNGMIIDGGNGGNDSRYINHSCEPNCEGHESEDGNRVFIVALRDIAAGEELLYDYALTIDDKITKTLKKQYACLCGTPSCRGTMLALPKPSKKQRKKAKKKKWLKKIIRQAVREEIQDLLRNT
ncbi:MAG: SET domain-containing protein [Alcaligenaceae bacterium]|uniref:SET domain-containing protein-lysine N-methyltransferase n=1 Tax=Paenalcaligenes hermetiae TaxID=1157987 RepID=A0ABP9M5W9_9BURK|nr:SET domain-containing protein-lysine N-methyltransferase [Paenalcaligenes sp.]NLJ63626.1 SET domain-containing protein [Alcaligenaceae bacterium]